ncbi:sulfide/dihydroorotate dehydrogenase-like FAD/NAD-binding protein [Treponema sp.]|uniref:sulfide/dihydroorotate dehydrogenase-like FAD/NAD-binding protein n=1 Tax=Treponema sp. TaxID=166 RepID=UPI003F0E3388
MNKILEKRKLSETVYYMKFEAPDIAKNRKAGQFLIVQYDNEMGERIPLTIADANAEEGWVAIVFQAVGAGTMKISRLNEGEYLAAVLGPLGTPSKIEKYDAPVLCVGGGIGTAPLYPIVQALKAAGNKVIVVICARTKDLLIFVDEMKAVADEVIIMTDDGSAGRQGVSTVPVEELCQSQTPPAEVIAIGPPIMMKFVCATTEKYNVKTTVSLNTIMIDGTGMCGGCRVSVGGKTKFVCVDGPDFDGHQVDWANMMTRMKSFKDEEEKHKCKIGM